MGNSQPKKLPEGPIDQKDLIGVYSATTGKDHQLYIELRADGVVKWRHDLKVDGKEASGDCTGRWEYKHQPSNEIVFSNLIYEQAGQGGAHNEAKNGVGFMKSIPVFTLLNMASFEVVQLAATKAATSSAKRVSIVGSGGTGSGAIGKGAALRATYKKIKTWPADYGNTSAETSPDRCVGCSTTFKY